MRNDYCILTNCILKKYQAVQNLSVREEIIVSHDFFCPLASITHVTRTLLPEETKNEKEMDARDATSACYGKVHFTAIRRSQMPESKVKANNEYKTEHIDFCFLRLHLRSPSFRRRWDCWNSLSEAAGCFIVMGWGFVVLCVCCARYQSRY